MKSTKHQDKLGKLEDFKAPWEADAGEVEVDNAKLKKLLYDTKLERAKAQDAFEDAAEEIETARTEATDAVKAKKAAEKKLADADSTGEISSLTEKLKEATARADKAETSLLRLEVGTEKGLNPKQAARLQGATKEELEADADDLLESFGLSDRGNPNDNDDDDDDDDRESDPLRRAPRRLTTPGVTPAGGDDGPRREVDFLKALEDAGI